MADRTIDILLNLTTSGNAAKKVSDLTKSLNEMETEARETEAAIERMKKSGEDTSRLETSLKTVRNAIQGVKKDIEETRRPFEEMKKAADATRERMEKIAQVGTQLAAVGALITGPLVMAAKKYVDTVKDAEPASRKILQITQQLERSQITIGRVLATEYGPALEKAADTVTRIANFVERNPGIAKAIANIGLTLTVAGGLTVAAAQLATSIATIQGLAAAGGAGGMAAGSFSGLQKATIAIGTAYIAFEGGKILFEQFGKVVEGITGLKREDMLGIAGDAANQLANDLGLFGQAIKSVTGIVLEYGGVQAKAFGGSVNDKMTGSAGNQAKSLSNDLFRLADAEKKAAEEADAAAKKTEAAADRYQSIQNSIASLIQQMAEYEQQRSQERQRILDEAAKAEQRAAEDHARALQEIEERRQRAVQTAAQQRDAIALVEAENQAKEETDDENEKYAMEKKRRAEDLRDQLRYFDQETRNQREQDARKLEELQRMAAYELQIIQQTEYAKLQIFQDVLNQVLSMGGLIGGGLGSMGDTIPPIAGDTRGGMSRQTVNINMANGMTLSQMRREINSANRKLSNDLANALAAI